MLTFGGANKSLLKDQDADFAYLKTNDMGGYPARWSVKFTNMKFGN